VLSVLLVFFVNLSFFLNWSAAASWTFSGVIFLTVFLSFFRYPTLKCFFFQVQSKKTFFFLKENTVNRRCLLHPHFRVHVHLNVCSLGWVTGTGSGSRRWSGSPVPALAGEVVHRYGPVTGRYP
jgi:hypothetical protein